MKTHTLSMLVNARLGSCTHAALVPSDDSEMGIYGLPVAVTLDRASWWEPLRDLADAGRALLVNDPDVDNVWILWDGNENLPIWSAYRATTTVPAHPVEEHWVMEGWPPASPWAPPAPSDDPTDRPGANF